MKRKAGVSGEPHIPTKLDKLVIYIYIYAARRRNNNGRLTPHNCALGWLASKLSGQPQYNAKVANGPKRATYFTYLSIVASRASPARQNETFL